MALSSPPQAIAAGGSVAAFACPDIEAPGYCGDDGPALRAGLGAPADVVALPGGGYLVADAVNDAVRVVSSDGLIRTLVGPQPGTPNGARSPLRFPTGLSTTPGGGVLVADAGHSRVILRDPAGRVSVVAGDGAVGYGGDGGAARRAQLSEPMAVASAPNGETLIADTGNNRVRRVTGDGTITTVAGTGMRGFGGDGGPAALAPLTRPVDIAALPSGGFIVATADGRVRRVDERGMISSITDHRFAGAPAIAPLSDGEVLVTEPLASRVVRVSLDGSVRQLVSGAGCEATPRDRDGAGESLRYPAALAAGADGGVIVADSGSRRVVRIDDHRVGLVAGGGLRVPSDACGGRAAPMRLLEGLPPGPRAADSQYGGGLRCRRPGETRLFNVAFRYMKPRRPRARHRFRLRFEVTVLARVRLTARRGGRRWKAPRRHSAVRSGRFWLGYPHGLRAGRYHFTLVADARNQRQCVKLKRRIRRARR